MDIMDIRRMKTRVPRFSLSSLARFSARRLYAAYFVIILAAWLATSQAAQRLGETVVAQGAPFAFSAALFYPLFIFILDGDSTDFLGFVRELLEAAASAAVLLALRLTCFHALGHLSAYELIVTATLACFGVRPLLRWRGGWVRAALIACYAARTVKICEELAASSKRLGGREG